MALDVDGSTASSDAVAGARTEDERLFAVLPPVAAIDYTPLEACRIMRIMGEFVEGFDRLAGFGRRVGVCGAR